MEIIERLRLYRQDGIELGEPLKKLIDRIDESIKVIK